MKRNSTKYIILHHSVTNQLWDSTRTMANIKGSHSGISPYHRCIGYNWQWSDPHQDEVKYHAGNYQVNLESIAVAMVGDFTQDTPTEYQKQKLKETLQFWMNKYQIKRENIKLHREVRLNPTACPGKLDQSFISKLLKPMTCEQDLKEERDRHAETLERERTNYANWQEEIDKRKKAEADLAQERSDHTESIAEKLKNAAERDAALDKIRGAKAALG